MKKYARSLFSLVTLITIVAIGAFAVTGCALFKPTPQGTCPTLTVNGAELAAFGAATAGLKSGMKSSDLTLIESNITATVATGQFNADLIAIAIKNAGANQWVGYLGVIDVIFGQQFNSVVNSNANGQVCTVPIANAIVAGMQLAQTLAPQPVSGALKAVSPAVLAKAQARLQYLLHQK